MTKWNTLLSSPVCLLKISMFPVGQIQLELSFLLGKSDAPHQPLLKNQGPKYHELCITNNDG